MTVPKLSSESRIVRCDQFVAADMDDDLVMMSLENSNYYSLDPIGKRIWAFLEEPLQVSELVDRLTAEFEVERPRCLADVLGFLNELAEAGLVRTIM